jgi:simple sugar transport system permease protein
MSMEVKADRPLGGNRRTSSPIVQWARRNALQLGIVGVALLVWLVFLIGSPRTFLSYPIYNAFMSSTPYFAIMAIPLTLVVITGEIDLSFPSIAALGMALYAIGFSLTGNVWVAFVVCIGIGLLAGLFNGVVITKVGIPSLVATLATQFLFRGIVLVMRGGNGQSLVASKGSGVDALLVGRVFDKIPMQFILTIIVAVVIWFFLNRHRFGAHVYAVGDNEDSSRLMGINVDKVKTLTFVIVGGFAALSGLIQSLDVSYFWPTVAEGQLLNTLASVFLGGTSVFGGTGTIFGTFVASFIIGAINAGIVAAGLTGMWTQVIYGAILLISVGIQTVVSRKLRR